MSLKVAFLSMYFLCCSSCLEPIVENLDLTNCAVEMAREFFRNGRIVTLIDLRHWNKSEVRVTPKPQSSNKDLSRIRRIVKSLHVGSRWAIKTTDNRQVCRRSWNPDEVSLYQYLNPHQFMIVGNEEVILDCVNNIPPRFLRQRGLFLANTRLDKTSVKYLATIKRIMQVISERQLNCKLLVTSGDGTLNVYGLLSVEQDGFGLALSDTCSNGTLRKMNAYLSGVGLPAQQGLTNKRFRSGNLVRIAVVEKPPWLCKTKTKTFTGLDLEIIKIVAKMYNMSLDIVESRPPKNSNLLPWHYALTLVSRGEADLTLGRFIALNGRINDFRHSHPLMLESVRWYVSMDVAHHSITFNRILFLELFIVYAATSAMFLMSWSPDSKLKEHTSSTFLLVWAMFMEQSVRSIQLLTRKQRALLVIAAFVTINVNGLIKSLAVSDWTKPIYTQSIKTIEDLVKSDIPIIYDIPDDFLDFKEEDFKRIRPRLHHCPDFPHCLRRLNLFGSFGAALFKTTAKFGSISHPGLFFNLDVAITGIQVSTYSSWASPILDDFDKVISRIHEAGLLAYWRRKLMRRNPCYFKLEPKKDFFGESKPDSNNTTYYWTETVSWAYLTSGAKVLLFGYGAAALSFFGEIAIAFLSDHLRCFRQRRI